MRGIEKRLVQIERRAEASDGVLEIVIENSPGAYGRDQHEAMFWRPGANCDEGIPMTMEPGEAFEDFRVRLRARAKAEGADRIVIDKPTKAA